MLSIDNPYKLFSQMWKVLWETEVSINGLKLKQIIKDQKKYSKLVWTYKIPNINSGEKWLTIDKNMPYLLEIDKKVKTFHKNKCGL